MATTFDKFQRMLVARSKSNTEAIILMHEKGLYGNSVATLRQELDSLIRVNYLNGLTDDNEVLRLISDSVNGVEWKRANSKRITDRTMLNIVSEVWTWAAEVYEFGNAFTHLTNFHDYLENDPMSTLSAEKKNAVKSYLTYYHQFPQTSEVTFANVVPYIPQVATKISNNLRASIAALGTKVISISN
ncbi:hypothetical protein [Dyadobacter sp. 22481]|uniref:hypothetical protein n=1 Tax=Dyadobacter sp. 22481 TaxID=3453926 RepID=UPI003F84CC19